MAEITSTVIEKSISGFPKWATGACVLFRALAVLMALIQVGIIAILLTGNSSVAGSVSDDTI